MKYNCSLLNLSPSIVNFTCIISWFDSICVGSGGLSCVCPAASAYLLRHIPVAKLIFCADVESKSAVWVKQASHYAAARDVGWWRCCWRRPTFHSVQAFSGRLSQMVLSISDRLCLPYRVSSRRVS